MHAMPENIAAMFVKLLSLFPEPDLRAWESKVPPPKATPPKKEGPNKALLMETNG